MDYDYIEQGDSGLQAKTLDKPCVKCGTIISFSTGIADCPRCAGLSVNEKIDLHIKQSEEHYSRKNTGYLFLIIFLALSSALYFFVL